jgi:hypothetical protein
MTLEKFIEAINLPKLVVEKAEAFLTALLGEAVKESGGLIGDKVRYQRFKNQVLILRKSQTLLEEAGLQPRPIPMKTLVPLVESCSLEDDPDIQEMWARLLADAASSDSNAFLHAIGVQLLSSISVDDAKLLQLIYTEFLDEQPKMLAKFKEWGIESSTVYPDSITFRPRNLFSKLGFDVARGDLLLDNLLRLNLVKYELPEIKDNELWGSDQIHLTTLGRRLLEVCSSHPAKHKRHS